MAIKDPRLKKAVRLVIKQFMEDQTLAFMDIMKDPRVKGKVGWTTVRYWLDEMKREGLVKPVAKIRRSATGKRDGYPTSDEDIDQLKNAAAVCYSFAQIATAPYFVQKGWDRGRVRDHCMKNGIILMGKAPPPPDKVAPAEAAAIEKIRERYSPEELRAIAGGVRFTPGQTKVPIISFEGERVRFLACSDPHFGSKRSAEQHWIGMIKEAKKEKVEFAVCAGDITNGMDTQKAPHYEQDHIGYAAQKERAIEMLSLLPVKTYVISGNHDLWYKKQNSAEIVPDICDAVKGCEYLGEHEGDISLKGKAVLKLWHGNDGSSYALSYRLQKILEALTGGEKPNILIAGHSHKALYIYERMVHTLAAGAMQMQTQWMRTKRLASHTGFWIIDVWVNKGGVAKFAPTFYPFYS